LKQGAIVVGMADEGGYEGGIITVTKLKLKSGEHIYVKIRWLQDESLHITALNGLLAWSYHMSVQDVAEIASAWGINVGEFMEMAALHLCLQDPAATYSFRALDFNWTWALFSWTMAGRKVKLELKKEQDPAAIVCNVFDHILGKIERLKTIVLLQHMNRLNKQRLKCPLHICHPGITMMLCRSKMCCTIGHSLKVSTL